MATRLGNRLFALFSASITLLILAGCTGVSTHDDGGSRSGYRISGSFPVPNEIEGNVALWTNVYGRWSRNQVAFHDDTHMGIVYEVVDLPDWASGGDVRDWISARQAELKGRLGALEVKTAAGDELTAEERELHNKIVSVAGPQGVYGARERLRSQRGMREKFRRGLEISGRYDAAFREIFRSEGLPEDIAYLPHVESSFQTNARSSVGAAGVWQFMPATGRLYMNVGNGVDERLDPVTAAGGAARYLRNAYERLGSWPLAITSYNHGVGGMQNARNQYGDDFGRIVQSYKGPAFGFSSRNFYASFLAAREVASQPQKFFPEGVAFEPPLPAKRIQLDQSKPAHQIAREYDVDLESLTELNLAWLGPVRSGRASVPAGTAVWVPTGAAAREPARSLPEPTSFALAMSDESPPTVSYPATSRSADKVPEPAKTSKSLTLAKAEGGSPAGKPATVALTKAETQAAVKTGTKLATTIASAPTPATNSSKMTAAQQAPPASAKGSKSVVSPKSEAVVAADKKDKGLLVLAKAEPTNASKARSNSSKAQAPSSPAKGNTTTTAKATPAPAPTKGSKAAAETKPKLHVVQPNETFYRVADLYDLTVEALKRLNGISSKENTLRPGQRLRVSI